MNHSIAINQPPKTQVSGHEIAEVLRRVGRGEVEARLVNPDFSWDKVLAGNVEFEIAGYRIVIFNDCNELDYVDSVITPDDRVGDFEDWYAAGEEPVNLLTPDDRAAVALKLKAAI